MSWRTLALVALGALLGTALAATPATAHVTSSVRHLAKHMRATFFTKAQSEARYVNIGEKAASAGQADSAANAEALDGLDATAFQRSSAPAGGDLAGTYPNPTLRPGAVTPTATGPVPAVRVEQAPTPSQAIPSSGLTTFSNVVFQTEVYDTDAMFTSAQNDRITFRTAGIYAISGAVRWDANVTGIRSVGLVRNAVGIAFMAADTRTAASDAASATRQNVSTVTCADAGDFVQLKVSQNSGSSLALSNNGSPQVHLGATWLGPSPGPCPSP